MENLNDILAKILEKLEKGEKIGKEELNDSISSILDRIAKENGTSTTDVQTRIIVSDLYCDGDMDEFLRFYGNIENNIDNLDEVKSMMPNDKYGELVTYVLPRLMLIHTILETKKISRMPIDVRKVGILLEELGQKLKEYEGEI